MLGFKRFRRAKVTIAGIELLHCIRKNQFNLGKLPKPRLRFGTRCSPHDQCGGHRSDRVQTRNSHQSPFYLNWKMA